MDSATIIPSAMQYIPVVTGQAMIPGFLFLSSLLYIAVKLLHFAEEPQTPDLFFQPSTLNNFLLRMCPVLHKVYSPPLLWGRNGKLLTLVYGALGRVKHVFPKGERFNVKLCDGATVFFDIFQPVQEHESKVNCTLVVCPGIGNCSESIYIRSFIDACQRSGYRVVVLNHLGVLPNVKLTSPRIFHYGDTRDFAAMVEFTHKKYSDSLILGVGFSMGANILLKYLAESEEHQKIIRVAISACQGYSAEPSIDYLYSHGWVIEFLSKIILKRQLRIIRNHASTLFDPKTAEQMALPPADHVLNSSTIREYDELYTRRVAGYSSLSDFYTSVSCCNILNKVNIPVFLFNALDDPIVPGGMLHYPRNFALSRNNVIYAQTLHGGHLGYFEGGFIIPNETNWMDRLIIQYLNAFIQAIIHGYVDKGAINLPKNTSKDAGITTDTPCKESS